GHLGRELGRGRELLERTTLAQRAVLGQATARLAQDPEGAALGGLAAQGSQQKVVHGECSDAWVKRYPTPRTVWKWRGSSGSRSKRLRRRRMKLSMVRVEG